MADSNDHRLFADGRPASTASTEAGKRTGKRGSEGSGNLLSSLELTGQDANQPYHASDAPDEADETIDEADEPSFYTAEINTPFRRCLYFSAYAVLVLGFLAYLAAALYFDWRRALPMVLTLLSLLALYVLIESGLWSRWWERVRSALGGWLACENRLPVSPGRLGYLLVGLGYVAVLVVLLISKEWLRLVSLAGVLCLTLTAFACSVSRRNVDWRPVCWGLALQFIFGALIMRTSFGFWLFELVGEQVQKFLAHSDYGAQFIFGDDFATHYLAFKVLPTIVFFSACIQAAYYLGWVQAATRQTANLMVLTMRTTPAESLSVASNIFIGMTEAMLLVRVFIPTMTCSELHAVMVGGFSTVAGGVLAAYISFGVSAAHLISASVMSAPAAMAMAKLFYPELEVSRSRDASHQRPLEFPPVEDRSLIEALSSGAMLAIPLVANILALLIAFLGALSLVNAILAFFGSYINLPQLNFDTVVAVPLTPVALLLGVPPEDAYEVAKLIGQKTFLNEFVAYLHLAELITNRKEQLDGPTISLRAEVISTYALCGFANLGSIGIQIGALTPMAPHRKRDILNLVVRAMVAGTFASLLTACVAGILWDPEAKSLHR